MEIETPELLSPSFYMVSCTQPTAEMKELQVETPLELIAYCARVSNPANQSNSETATRLLDYLVRNQHWSPLEMVDVTFEIITARDIGRQILRHKTAVFQEFSQRYADVADDQHCLREARLEHPTNRQSSVECEDPAIIDQWIQHQLEVLEVARRAYNWARKQGIAKECARVVLPEGLTLSTMYMKAPLRTWVHYTQLRGGNGTQKEHMQIARGLAEALLTVFPSKQLEVANA